MRTSAVVPSVGVFVGDERIGLLESMFVVSANVLFCGGACSIEFSRRRRRRVTKSIAKVKIRMPAAPAPAPTPAAAAGLRDMPDRLSAGAVTVGCGNIDEVNALSTAVAFPQACPRVLRNCC